MDRSSWGRHPCRWRGADWLTRAVSALVGLVLLALTSGCGSSSRALNSASPEVKDLVAQIAASDVPASYRFTYTAIGPLFMGCLSGVEDIDGAVDAERRAMVVSSRQRAGKVYSLDGELLIERELLGLPDRGHPYVRIPVDATTDAETLSRIDRALGTSLSAMIAGGAWPTHPNDLVESALSIASSITSIEPDGRSLPGIRIVLDSAGYLEQFDETISLERAVPPIIDVYVAAEGTVQRLVVRLPDSANPTTPSDHSDGYAVDYRYGEEVEVVAPGADEIADMQATELPRESTPIPCVLEQ